MKIIPGPEEVARYRETGLYKVVPVRCELLADLCTPIQVVRKLKRVSSHCFLLESAEAQENWGRYSFLGFDPKLSITCSDGEMRVGELKLRTEDPTAVLRQILAEYKSPRVPGMPPFTGGLTGYFSYDYFKVKQDKLGFAFAALALLFQPFLKITLGRTIWNIVDVMAAILLVWLTIVAYRKKDD